MNGWKRANSTINDSAMVIAGGSEGAPAAPDGLQMLRLMNAKDDFGVSRGAPFASLKFVPTEVADRLSFSGMVGFTGDVSAKTGVIARFYLSNAEKTEAFMGPSFGIWQEKGSLRFFHTKAPRGSAVSFGEATIEIGKFYRFQLDINVRERSYKIRVYDVESGALLGSADDGRFRNDTAIGINYLRLNNQSDPAENGDDFITYFDQIQISAAPLSES